MKRKQSRSGAAGLRPPRVRTTCPLFSSAGRRYGAVSEGQRLRMAEFQGVLCPCTLGFSSLLRHMAATAAAAAAAVAMPAGEAAAASGATGSLMRRLPRCWRRLELLWGAARRAESWAWVAQLLGGWQERLDM